MTARRRTSALAAIVLLGAGGIALPVAQAQIARYEAQAVAEDERQALEDARARAKVATEQAALLEQRADSARDAAERARQQGALLAAQVQRAEADTQLQAAQLAIVQRQVRVEEKRLADQQQPLVRLVAALQRISQRPAVAVLAQPGSATDVIHLHAVLDTTMPAIEAKTRTVRRELAALTAAQNRATAALARVRSAATQLTEKRAALAKLEAEQRVQSRTLNANARLEEIRAEGLADKARDIGSLVGRLSDDAARADALARLGSPPLRPESGGLASILAAAPSAPSRPAQAPRGYRLPAVGRLISGTGEVVDGVRARGLTLAPMPGAQAVAPASGKVVFAGPFQSYGPILIIDHGAGWTTLITGLASVTPTVGSQLDTGDPVGRAAASRPRITVELRDNGKPVDVAALIG